jgi:hypothetical protein
MLTPDGRAAYEFYEEALSGKRTAETTYRTITN